MDNKPSSLYWYDYETFGRHPGLDRPSQFAGLRTTLDLEPLGEPLLIYNRLTDDYLPEPGACLVNHIAPQEAQAKGAREPEFIRQILRQLSVPGTCQVGYNNIRFDDEFTRFTLFRNFFDPYQHEWKNGNSRWDLIDVVRLTRALRPQGIQWPTHADGSPSNRLEDIASANGVEHLNAHDALSDVEATIAVARLIKENQPKLYNYAFTHRDKASIAALLNTRDQEAVVHVSGMISGEFGHTAVVAPLIPHPTNRNGIVVLDLRQDPSELGSLDAETIRQRIFTPQRLLPAGESHLAIKTIHINKAPVVVPLSTLDDASAERLHINKQKSLKHLQTLQSMGELPGIVSEAISKHEFKPPGDVDATLYSGGFFSPEQRQLFAKIREADADELNTIRDCFNDSRCNEMLFRYRARNFAESLDKDEQLRWQDHCRDKLMTASEDGNRFERYRAQLNEEWPESEQQLKKQLQEWADLLEQKLNE